MSVKLFPITAAFLWEEKRSCGSPELLIVQIQHQGVICGILSSRHYYSFMWRNCATVNRQEYSLIKALCGTLGCIAAVWIEGKSIGFDQIIIIRIMI